MDSPYKHRSVDQWEQITEQLVESHPLDTGEILEVTLEAWQKIMSTKIGDELQIGVDLFPSPQILGNYLHELISALMSKRHPDVWRREQTKEDKDLVCLRDNNFSIEIKTSS